MNISTRTVRIIAGIIIVIVGFACIPYIVNYTPATSNVTTHHYKSIHEALNDGSIQYGMTYEQIKEICGPATSVSRTNGQVKYAYYGYTQLCFWHGQFDHWND